MACQRAARNTIARATADVQRLTDWRNRHVSAFLTEFEATPERTAQWLADVVGPAGDRMLLMADDADGRTFGYLGIAYIDWAAGRVEADAIVRGESADKGAMTACLLALLGWARDGLGLRDVWVRVRSDNPALGFYRRLGFVERHAVPLRRETEPGLVRWVEDPALADAEVSLVHMQLPEEDPCAS